MRKEREDERVSLEGLDPEEALKALLAVDPDAEPAGGDDDERENRAAAPTDTPPSVS
jgi:hypothetical protein